jgi:hypothetical protein
MKPSLLLDEVTGDFVKLILEMRPNRLQCAEILRKARKVLNKKNPVSGEFLRRIRELLHIEANWQARKEENRMLATMWGASLQ